MDNKTIVYKAYKDMNGKIASRTLLENQSLPKGCYWLESEALEAYNKREAEKLVDYNKYRPLALARLDKLENDIKQLLKDSKADLYFTYEGESHGTYNERMEISTTVNGHEYTKEIDLNWCEIKYWQ